MARNSMAGLISHFRLFRGDLTSSVLTDGQVEALFDLGKAWIDKEKLKADSEGLVFVSSRRFIESDATIADAAGVTVTPDEADHVNGIYSFNSSQSGELYLSGYSHNLYQTVALAYRAVAGSDELWQKYRRGGIELTKYDLEKMASAFEKMGFRRDGRKVARG